MTEELLEWASACFRWSLALLIGLVIIALVLGVPLALVCWLVIVLAGGSQ